MWASTSGSRLAQHVLAESGESAQDAINKTPFNYQTLADLQADVGHVVIGQSYKINERATGNGGGAWWKCVAYVALDVNTYNVVDGDGSTKMFELQVGDILNIKQWGAKGDGIQEDHAYIQAALDYSYGVAGDNVLPVYAPSGEYIIGDTVYLPQIIDFYGAGVTLFTAIRATKMQAKVGLQKDMFRVKPNLYTTYWWAGRVRDMNINGDGGTGGTGTIGNGIALLDSASAIVTAQDGALFNNLIIENMPESGLLLPSGSVPLHVRDFRGTDCGRYGIEYIQGLGNSAHSLHLDNISGDLCVLGLVLLKDLDPTSNVLITNAKAEAKDTNQRNTIVIDNCDRAVITIDTIHTTNSSQTVEVPPSGIYYPPRECIKITGVGCPILKWDGYAARIRVSDVDVDQSYVLEDAVSGKTFHASKRFGSYNGIGGRRISNSSGSIANFAGANIAANVVGIDAVSYGDLVAGAVVADMLDVFQGQAYVVESGSDRNINVRRQNESGALFSWTTAYYHVFKVPDRFIKNRVKVPAVNPGTIAVNTSVTSVNTLNGVSLGDFVMYSHEADQTSTVGTCHVSAANTVTTVWTAARSGRTVPSADLNLFAIRDSSFSITESITYDPPTVGSPSLGASPAVITVPGAALGDVVLAAFSLDLQGMQLSAYVSAPNTVEVLFLNFTGGAINLASGQLKVGILDKNSV